MNFNYIIDHLSKKKKNIEERFNNWLKNKSEYYAQMAINPRELNERYNLLNRPFNSYCRTNYIDYNFVVDQILQMSLPYSEAKQSASQEYPRLTLSEPSMHETSLKTGLNLYNNIRHNEGAQAITSLAQPAGNSNQNALNIYNSINSRPDLDMKLAISNNNLLNSLGSLNNEIYINPNTTFMKNDQGKFSNSKPLINLRQSSKA